MKTIKLSLALLVLSAPLSGCISMWNNDGFPGTESRLLNPRDSQYKPDRQWRKVIAKDWDEYDKRLSRLRLGEFID